MTQVLQGFGHLGACYFIALLRDFVTDTPHHYTGVIAVGQYQIGNVLLPPLIKETGITILTLRIFPHVEALGHHHHTQRIANIHLHLTGHIVRCTNCIATHRLHHLDLSDKCTLVDGGTQRTKVVMQANTLNFARYAIKLETTIL